MTIYTASKTRHAHLWRSLRSSGYPIISTWIDEAGVGESSDLNDLWYRCITEAGDASTLLLYREPGDELKGAWIELGVALAKGRRVLAVGINEYTIAHYETIQHFNTLEEALSVFPPIEDSN